MKFGIFLAPFHPVGQNPTLALERDLELVVHLDRLGYDEAWIGEHHSAGYEIIASPEVFIATAAERTKHIRLGTGVSSLPYHHPLMLTDRLVLLDHLTRGRVMLGVGPGALPSDAFMMGIPVAEQRSRMEEALEAILLLLRSDEPVTMKTDWFTLDDARLNLRPYTQPHFEVAVASQISPAGSRAAGRFGTGLLSIGATNQQGFDLLGYHWQIAEERAAQFDTSVDRGNWRLVGPVHIAETREQAYADVQFGLADWVDYFQRVAALPIAPDTSNAEEMADAINQSGFAVIGTPDDAIAQLQRLWDQSNGGFGTFLVMAHEWADTAETRRSYELLARYVFPAFQGSADSTTSSRDWAAENRPTFIGEVGAAIMTEIGKHNAEHEGVTGAAGVPTGGS
ncbi:MAG TPA: LLM class flavin-dependent oxidoreductase [Acidimicrobiales bacterium]|jgi:limonene 1,2-monooxygenase|nr:LLM class flavin-dependent oxidoreductase [Acidimicrobiales bacterium]